MDKVICVFGDSNTFGFWDFDKGGWVNRLRLYFDSKSPDNFYVVVYNLGIDGDDTSSLLKRFEAECKTRNPSVIIFDIGSNDTFLNLNGENNISLKQFETNIISLINQAKKFTNKIVFVGFLPVDESKTSPVLWDKNISYTEKEIKKYNDKLKDLIKKAGVLYIDISNMFSNMDLEDGVHLNSLGHEKLFNKVKEFLIKNKII